MIKQYVFGIVLLFVVEKCKLSCFPRLSISYHTKRMQRIFCVNFSADARFVLTGSDDTNIRIWKAQASAPLCKKLLYFWNN